MTLPPGNLLDPQVLGTWLATRRRIWQMELLDANSFARFCDERAVTFQRREIHWLWQLGFLRADLVVSKRKLRRVGLVEVGRNDQSRTIIPDERDHYVYADTRALQHRPRDWDTGVTKLPPFPKGVQLLFHPFRYYVLLQIEQAGTLHVTPAHPPTPRTEEAFPEIVDWYIARFRLRFHPSDFVRSVAIWNDITALAVATEPCIYSDLFQSLHHSGASSIQEQLQRIREYWRAEVAPIYHKIGITHIEEARQALCEAADRLDPNETVYMILRLADGDLRLNLKGHIGGAVYLRTMAEMLRRAAEDAYDPAFLQETNPALVHRWVRAGGRWCELFLREEDELGIGFLTHDAKPLRYGARRILDGDRTVAITYLRNQGLDYHVRLRWYVEGDTEFGAIKSRLDEVGRARVEVINLKGLVVASGGKGVGFRGDLRRDIAAQVFSFVTVDSDRSDYVSAVQQAARDNEICGAFFIPQRDKQDFEFDNFDLAELETILWEIACENGAEPEEQAVLHEALMNVHSAKELFKAAQRVVPTLATADKSGAWGVRLMRYARLHPNRENGTSRPINEAVDLALQIGLFNYDYRLTREDYEVNPDTGQLVRRRLGT